MTAIDLQVTHPTHVWEARIDGVRYVDGGVDWATHCKYCGAQRRAHDSPTDGLHIDQTPWPASPVGPALACGHRIPDRPQSAQPAAAPYYIPPPGRGYWRTYCPVSGYHDAHGAQPVAVPVRGIPRGCGRGRPAVPDFLPPSSRR